MTNPWRRVRFEYPLGVVVLLDLVIYALYVLARIDSEEYRMLNWFIVFALGMLLVSFLIEQFYLSPGPPTSSSTRMDMSSLVLTGIIIMMVLQVGLSMAFELIHSFSFLENNWLEIYLGVHVAIFEEIMRFSLLRVIGGWTPRFVLPPMIARTIPVVIVNTIWTGYHVISYQNAPFQVWLGLWASGLIITYAMAESQSLTVAVLIHASWNIMVTFELSSLILQILGVVVFL